MPCLKEIYAADENRLKSAAMRHFDFFNTHPYIANTIIALTLILENENVAAGEETKSQQIKSLKLHLGGPLAALGDTFFWARIKPFCGLIAAGYVFVRGFNNIGYFLIPSLIFIFLYNMPHIFFRFFGFWLGLKYKVYSPCVISARSEMKTNFHFTHSLDNKTDVAKIISNFKIQKISEIIRIAGIFVCIFVLIMYLMSSVYPVRCSLSNGVEYLFAVVLVFFVSLILMKKNISIISVFWGLVVGCVGAGFLI